jgi:uncharacterized membrane protein (UPF0127 family)
MRPPSTLVWITLLAACTCAWAQQTGTGGDAPRSLRRDALVEIRAAPDSAPVRVAVEVADEPREQSAGLMHRHLAGDGEGMLFVFPRVAPRAFWMHNTPESLDLLFLDADLHLVALIPSAEPLSDRVLQPDAPAQYVLEVPGGFASRHALELGAQARVIPEQRPAATR